jgi:hypothetical protein
VDKPLCDLPTCPHGATTTTDCRRWFPHETTRGLAIVRWIFCNSLRSKHDGAVYSGSGNQSLADIRHLHSAVLTTHGDA